MKGNQIRNIGILGCAMLLACGGDSPTQPDGPPRPITIVSGGGAIDTVNVRLLQALIVEVRVNGALKPGVIVRFNALASTDATRSYERPVLVSSLSSSQYTTFIADSTDASGRARVLVQLGTIAGPTGVAISVPEIGLEDTARYTVRPGNAARITMKIRDTAVAVGASYNIGASVADVFGNARTDVPTYTPTTTYTTVDTTGVVKATSAGRAGIVVKSGTYTDTARVSVIPDGTIVGVYYDYSVGNGINIVNLDGSGLKRLTTVQSQVMLPHWNRAGTSIVYYEGDPNYDARLYTVDLNGLRTLVNVASSATGPSTKFFPTYSADGQQLFFAGLPASGGYSAEIWRSQADGSGVTRMTSTPGVTSTEPSASPDGTKIVFKAGGNIATLDLATKVVKSLGVAGDFPQFSPDGTKILFLATGSYGVENLAIMNADGSAIRVLSDRSYDLYSGPGWSPDGTWIIIRNYGNLDLIRASNFEVLPLPKLNLGQASFKP